MSCQLSLARKNSTNTSTKKPSQPTGDSVDQHGRGRVDEVLVEQVDALGVGSGGDGAVAHQADQQEEHERLVEFHLEAVVEDVGDHDEASGDEVDRRDDLVVDAQVVVPVEAEDEQAQAGREAGEAHQVGEDVPAPREPGHPREAVLVEVEEQGVVGDDDLDGQEHHGEPPADHGQELEDGVGHQAGQEEQLGEEDELQGPQEVVHEHGDPRPTGVDAHEHEVVQEQREGQAVQHDEGEAGVEEGVREAVEGVEHEEEHVDGEALGELHDDADCENAEHVAQSGSLLVHFVNALRVVLRARHAETAAETVVAHCQDFEEQRR